MEINIRVTTSFRASTKEYVGTINIKTDEHLVTAKYTGDTPAEARNAAFASIGYVLLETTFKD